MHDALVHDEILLERMTWTEVRAALEAGRPTAIVACGAIEQHCPHLPLFLDAEHGTRLAPSRRGAATSAQASPATGSGASTWSRRTVATSGRSPECWSVSGRLSARRCR